MKCDGVTTPLTFLWFHCACKNVLKRRYESISVYPTNSRLSIIWWQLFSHGLVNLQRECTDCWSGHKWNVQGLGNYLNEELETNSKALLVLETLELLKGSDVHSQQTYRRLNHFASRQFAQYYQFDLPNSTWYVLNT